MKNILMTAMMMVIFLGTGFSQDFDSAIGLRLGVPSSVTYKKFINESDALEGYMGFRNYFRTRFVTLGAAYQIHKDIDEVDNLQYYYGGGASVYFWSSDFELTNTTSLGVQAYLGLSYTLEDLPLNFSVDWVPTFYINGLVGYGSGLGVGYGTLAVRYILQRNETQITPTTNTF